MHIAEGEDSVVQRMCIRTTGPPRTSPSHLILLRKHFLRVKGESIEPHMSSAAVRYHEFNCKIPPISLSAVILQCLYIMHVTMQTDLIISRG